MSALSMTTTHAVACSAYIWRGAWRHVEFGTCLPSCWAELGRRAVKSVITMQTRHMDIAGCGKHQMRSVGQSINTSIHRIGGVAVALRGDRPCWWP